MNAIDRLGSPLVDGPWRGNVKTVSTANLTLSGEQTISGVSCTSGDRVLASAQTSGAENGPWIVARGAWTRPRDWARESHAIGALFVAEGGTGIARYWRVQTSPPITIGSTSISIVPASQYGEVADGSVTAAKLASGAAVSNIGYQPGLQFATRAAAVAATVSASLTSFMLNGYHAEGDGGARACYVKLGSAPASTKAWHIQTADGAWWELRAEYSHQYLFGAQKRTPGQAGVNDADAIEATYAYSTEFDVPVYMQPGRNITNRQIYVYPRIDYPTNPNAYVEQHKRPSPQWVHAQGWTLEVSVDVSVGSPLGAVIQIGDGSFERCVRSGFWKGGHIFANNRANHGLYTTLFFCFTVEDIRIEGFKITGIYGGANLVDEFGNTNLSHTLRLVRPYIGYDLSMAEKPPAGCYAVYMDKSTDNILIDFEFRSVTYGYVCSVDAGWDLQAWGGHGWTTFPAANSTENTANHAPIEQLIVVYGDCFFNNVKLDGPFDRAFVFYGPRNHVNGLKINSGLLTTYGDAYTDPIIFSLQPSIHSGRRVHIANCGIKATVANPIEALIEFGTGVPLDWYSMDASNMFAYINDIPPMRGPGLPQAFGVWSFASAGAAAVEAPFSSSVQYSQRNCTLTRTAAGTFTVTLVKAIDPDVIVQTTAGAPFTGAWNVTANEVPASRTFDANGFITSMQIVTALSGSLVDVTRLNVTCLGGH